MKIISISFIGSDKNAGKTTSLNFVYQKLKSENQFITSSNCDFVVTSVGINGEEFDTYESFDRHKFLKPDITIYRNDYFITATDHLKQLNGQYQIVHVFDGPKFNKPLMLGRMLYDGKLILEGPNEKEELLEIKKYLDQAFNPDSNLCFFLIDGSIDRQFLAHPQISDYFFFSLLLSNRQEQINKANNLLTPLSFKTCSSELKCFFINHLSSEQIKSLLIYEDENNNKNNNKKNKNKNNFSVLYKGTEIAFLDDDLRKCCIKYSTNKTYLYLNSALTKSLSCTLAPFEKMDIILDNFTLYQDISTNIPNNNILMKRLSLLHTINVSALFMREETKIDKTNYGNYFFKFINNNKNKQTLINIFRENLDEIRVSQWLN
ncbi:MAG: hypothetical protein HQK51_00425 [Oligoflexia bacterium]|nr:hypothetical protein [Oligoflexia bacterium]